MIGALLILLLTISGVLMAAFQLYALVDKDREEEIKAIDRELAQVLILRSKNNDTTSKS